MRKLLPLLFLLAAAASAQVTPPQISFTGNFGCIGFPCQNAGTLIFPSDANYTASALEGSVQVIRLTSSVSLTATRSLILPSVTLGWGYTFYNETTGGQSINICGPTGTCAAIPHDGYAHWAGSDGTNFYTTPGAGCTPTLTTSGTSGAATLTGCAFNIPQYVAPTGAYMALTPSATQQVMQSQYGISFNNINTVSVPLINQSEIFLQDYAPGYDSGNGPTSAQGWSSDKGLFFNMAMSRRGIMQAMGGPVNHNGQGDTCLICFYLQPFGGQVAPSDEGVEPMFLQSHQKGYPTGVVAGSPALGAATITTNSFTCAAGYCITFAYNNTWDDGGIIFDRTQAGAALTLGAQSTWNGGISYALSSGTVTASSASGNINAASCTNNGNGQYQVYTLTTCNVTLISGTFAVAGSGCSSSTPTGTANDVGLVGPFQEESCISSVGAPSGGIQSVSFYTRYAWNGGTTLMMQGGPIGKAIVVTSTGTTWPIAYAVVGANSTTSLIISNCLANNGCGLNGVIPAATSAVTLYPMAFITGSSGAGAAVYLGLNNMAAANGDVLVGAPTSQYAQTGFRLVLGQTTPWASNSSLGMDVQDDGPVSIFAPYIASNTSLGPYYSFGYGGYTSFFGFTNAPQASGCIICINTSGGSSTTYHVLHDAGASGVDFSIYRATNTYLFNGNTSAPAFTAVGSAATTTAGQISYGGTTIAASNCGSLSGSAGCLVISVSGVQRYVPYW